MNTAFLRQGQRIITNPNNGLPKARAFKLGRFVFIRWPAQPGLRACWQAIYAGDSYRSHIGHGLSLRAIIKGEPA